LALFKLTDDVPLTLHGNLFFGVSAGSIAGFHKHGSQVAILHSNFTAFRVSSSMSAFEVGRNEVRIFQCVFSSFTAGSRIGSATFWQCSAFAVTADFVNISVRGDSRDSVVIAWLDGSLQVGSFVDSNFVLCPVKSGHLLFCEDSTKILLQNCCFANPRDLCINEHRAVSLNGTLFDQAQCPIRKEFAIGAVGYRVVAPSQIRARWNLNAAFLAFIGGALLVLIGQFLAKIKLGTL
jgi:hypothetical protein